MGGENVIAGILGMGSGRRSIQSQLQSVTNLRFSYCLPSWNNEAGTYTYLRFGDDAQISGNTQTMVQSTPMLPNVNRYYVTALSIFMNEVLLPIDVTVFQLRADRTNGFVIDSGSGATFLVPKAYNVIKEEMIKYFLAYNWHPMEISDLVPYDLCYNVIPSGDKKLPTLKIRFIGADLDLDSKRIFEVIDNMLCMIIMPINERGPSLLGAFQQVDYRFLFDVKASLLSFAPEKCQFN